MLKVMKYAPLISAVIRFVVVQAHAINWEELGYFLCFLVRAQVGLLPWESLMRVFPLNRSPAGSTSRVLGCPGWDLFLCLSFTWIQ